jgi:hypothetical protein
VGARELEAAGLAGHGGARAGATTTEVGAGGSMTRSSNEASCPFSRGRACFGGRGRRLGRHGSTPGSGACEQGERRGNEGLTLLAARWRKGSSEGGGRRVRVRWVKELGGLG